MKKMINAAKQVKLLAYSSRIAWGFKAGLSFLLTSLLALIAWNEKAFSIFFPLFTIIGIITDSILYLRRNKIFTIDIKDEDVAETYGLNAEELIIYAKKIPLVRLLRVIPGIFLFPLLLFSSKFSLPVTFLNSVLIIYFPAALADAFSARKLGIKLPSTYKLIFQVGLSSLSNHNSFRNSSSLIGMNQCFAEQSGVLGFRKPIYEPLNTTVTPISSPSISSCLSTYH
ncbi:MAG: hypothetical protein K2Q34_00320 [Alphaproteobacteria bacterium]|nr:hypothetical protein [Alphaproteobacteria bacterium]